MVDMVEIEFLKPSLPYLQGETAWFNELQAAAYIKQGFAKRAAGSRKYVPVKSRAEQIAANDQRAVA